jgi:hypothetical protein
MLVVEVKVLLEVFTVMLLDVNSLSHLSGDQPILEILKFDLGLKTAFDIAKKCELELRNHEPHESSPKNQQGYHKVNVNRLGSVYRAVSIANSRKTEQHKINCVNVEGFLSDIFVVVIVVGGHCKKQGSRQVHEHE